MNKTRESIDAEISKKMLADCNSVYLIDLDQRQVHPYIYQNEVAKSMAYLIGENNTYADVFREFADSFVLSEYRGDFLRMTDVEYIRQILEQQDSYQYLFRRYNTRHEVEIVEMRVQRIFETADRLAFMCFRSMAELKNGDRKSAQIFGETVNGKREILVVENDLADRENLRKILSSEYYVHTAVNFEDGLKLFRSAHRKLAAVIVGLDRYREAGFDFLQTVKNDSFLAHTPLLAAMSNPSMEEEQKCLDHGAMDLFAKPYNAGLILARLRNIARLREYTQTLSVVEFDELTGLYTKAVFMHYARRIIEENPQTDYLLLAMDIENFKVANIQYGVQKCDEMLAYLGKNLARVVTNGITGRFSGDCFVALIPKERHDSIDYLENIMKTILAGAPIPNQVVKMGVYGKYQKIDNTLPMVIYCDRAFLAVKKIKGSYNKNVTFFSPRMLDQFAMEQLILSDMEHALEQGQFEVFYQPKHDCFNDRIAGAEALIRWKHPELGFLPPSSFVPLFEQNGFVTKVDAYVIERVCAAIKHWTDIGLEPVPVSVNVSRRDLLEDGWVDNCLKIIEAYRIRHDLIHMEVTETIYTENTSRIIYMVNALREKGYLIEMDDFGAGYSSLGMLSDFPVDVIKMDTSFIKKLEENEIVVDTIIQLSHRMGFKLVAEGVETEKQCQKLKELGCDYIQGYYYSKPLPVDQFEQYLYDMQSQIPGNKESRSILGSMWIDPVKELEIKNTLLECIQVISDDQPESDRIYQLLTIISKFYQGTCSFIYEFGNGEAHELTVYEYHRDTANMEQLSRTDFDDAWIEGWKSVFAQKEDNYLASVASLKEYEPSLYENLTSQGIESLISVPIRRDNNIYGFIGVENPEKHTDNLFLLSSITHYIVNELNRNRTMDELKKMSFVDPLTGLRNRRAYYHDIERMEADPDKKEKSLGIIYADINGLKRTNDEEGHEAGDWMIRSVAAVLKKQFEESSIYRMGSDEFIVLIQGIKENELTDFVQILKESWNENATASVGVAWLPVTSKIEKWATKADRRMYKAKKAFYSEEGKEKEAPKEEKK